MPRPCKCRLVDCRPPVSAFKPAGVPGHQLEAVELGLDELEALRLADLEGLYQDAAAARMRISRATFGRLLAGARHKVAGALLQSKMLLFAGGPVVLRGMRNFECRDCGNRFSAPYGAGRPDACPRCQGPDFCRSTEERGRATRDAEPRGRGRCTRRRAGWDRMVQSASAAVVPAGARAANPKTKENQ
jgi:uncharacterized protein